MAIVTIETIWMDRITLLIASLFGCILACILLKQFYDQTTKYPLTIQMKIMNGFAISAIVSSAFYCGIRVIASFGIIKDVTMNCSIQAIILVFAWTTAKQLLYLFCTSRMDVAFRLSVEYKMSNKIFTMLYTMIIFGYSIQCSLFLIFWDGTRYEFGGNEYCTSVAPIWLFGIMGIWDLSMSTLLCLLFAKRLYCAHSKMQELNKNEIQKSLSHIAKYVTVSVVAVITTFIALFMAAITSWYTVAAIDSIINCLCIFLMYKKNTRIFNFICGACHKCVGVCIYQCVSCKNHDNKNDDETNIKNNTFLQIYSTTMSRIRSSTVEAKLSVTIGISSTSSTTNNIKSNVSNESVVVATTPQSVENN